MYQIGNVRAQKLHIILKFSELIIFLLVCCLLINCIGKQFFSLKQMLLPDIRHVLGIEFFVFQ